MTPLTWSASVQRFAAFMTILFDYSLACLRKAPPVLLFIAIVAACSREKPAPPPAPAPVTATRAPAATPVITGVKPVVASTPSHCAGDGSYQQAVDCFRIADHLRFTYNDGSGELKRPAQGAEHLEL